MDRRKYLKTLAAGSVGAAALIQGCDPATKPVAKETEAAPAFTIDRTAAEIIREKKLLSEKFFDDHEMKTIGILADIIIPKDETSGSATDSGVPAYIEFMAKDQTHYPTPLRGGIKWLDLQCMRRFDADFASCTAQQQIQIVDDIAYP